jgi:large subunit ribosomal protein L29e
MHGKLIDGYRVKELVSAQPVEEGSPQRVRNHFWRKKAKNRRVKVLIAILNSIKKPKTHRYPSLKGTDPKFRRNHRHALHGTMRALKEVKEGKRDAA